MCCHNPVKERKSGSERTGIGYKGNVLQPKNETFEETFCQQKIGTNHYQHGHRSVVCLIVGYVPGEMIIRLKIKTIFYCLFVCLTMLEVYLSCECSPLLSGSPTQFTNKRVGEPDKLLSHQSYTGKNQTPHFACSSQASSCLSSLRPDVHP